MNWRKFVTKKIVIKWGKLRYFSARSGNSLKEYLKKRTLDAAVSREKGHLYKQIESKSESLLDEELKNLKDKKASRKKKRTQDELRAIFESGDNKEGL